MNSRLLITLIILISSSCGLLGLYTDKTNYDQDFQKQAFAEMNNKPIARQQDSLIRAIDFVSFVTPSDITKTTLIVETYAYADYLKNFSNKFYILQDNKKNRKHFSRYERKKQSLLKEPICKVIYVDKGKYDDFEPQEYRYVLKTTTRILHQPDKAFVDSEGSVYAWASTIVYYIYDRQEKMIIGEIKDLKTLSQKN